MIHILIAPNAFKHSLEATLVATAIQKGLAQSKLKCTTECFPIGDGGDGTGDLIIKRCGGHLVETEVHDPIGRKIKASFGLIEQGKTAVIEMATASGIRLLEPSECKPLHTSTFGTGELLKCALNMNVNKFIIGMGGSATVDGGMGILSALGVRFLDEQGNELPCIPENLIDMATIDVSELDKRIFDCEVDILCDVDNTLLGKEGAAAIFGPQKGATESDVKKLEVMLANFARIAYHQTGIKMDAIKRGGTAGGAAAGLAVFLKARLLNGIDHFLELTGFDTALLKSNVLITGEGCIDEQTLQGKGPYGVALRAKNKNIPVIGLAGKVPLGLHPNLMYYFDVLMAIGHEPSDLTSALQTTNANLTRSAQQVGNLLALVESKNSLSNRK